MDAVIDIKNLCKSFNGKPAVKDLSLQVMRGEIFGFLGPNGSGKTTTIRMLCGLLIPDQGEGQCLGYNILTDSYSIKCEVGYMPQRFSLYEDLSIVENLDFIARVYNIPKREELIEKSLENLGLQHRRTQLAGTLSGGWKQRLALAAALLHKPKLLLLDEPTAGVDPKARREFWDHIHLLSTQGITTLVSTHYMDEAERCHRLAFILNGVLLTKGTEKEIIEKVNLTTWQVTGSDLMELAQQLRQKSAELQVMALGSILHVTYVDSNLASLIQPFQTVTKWHWQKIATNLEDLFVYLSEEEAL